MIESIGAVQEYNAGKVDFESEVVLLWDPTLQLLSGDVEK